MQQTPYDHHVPPKKWRDPDSYIKSQMDFKALLCSPGIWLNSFLVDNWEHSTHH